MTAMSLGRICWFSVATDGVPYADLVGWADELGLDRSLLPKQPDPREAYRKATTEARCAYELTGGMRAQIATQPLEQDPERMVRALVRQITDPIRHQLYHDQVGRVVFWRPPLIMGRRTQGGARLVVQLDYDRLADYERPQLERLAGQLRDRYDHYRTHVDGDNLRELVRRLLTGLRALRLSPSGGVYFVAAGRSGELRRVQSLAGRAQILLASALVVDTSEHRSMLAEALAAQADYQVRLLADNLTTALVKRPKLTAGQQAGFQRRADELLDLLEEHARLLGVRLDAEVADVLERVLEQLSA
jgi:hypothetical protein